MASSHRRVLNRIACCAVVGAARERINSIFTQQLNDWHTCFGRAHHVTICASVGLDFRTAGVVKTVKKSNYRVDTLPVARSRRLQGCARRLKLGSPSIGHSHLHAAATQHQLW